jgi:hypothetical protein
MKALATTAMAIIFCQAFSLSAAEQTIRLNAASGAKADYVISLLNVAFSHIETRYRIEKDLTPSTQSRIKEELKGGNLDLMWVSTNEENEQDYTPVRIPLLKGLLGYRLLIIRTGEQSRYDHIHSLQDLQKFTFGQGRTWADASILEANGLPLIKVTKMASLFHMLDGGRFDAFPRGASEPFQEIEKYPELNLSVEKNLLLAYKMPFYIFVAKGNNKLARDIELGLNRAIASGEFEELFLQNPSVKDVLEKANLATRRVIYLNNPGLPKATPLERSELWIDPQEFGNAKSSRNKVESSAAEN